MQSATGSDRLFQNLIFDPALQAVAEKVADGVRLSASNGITLFNSSDLLGIGFLANYVRLKKNQNRTYFICNCHINYTNICQNGCAFCAFGKKEDEAGAYTMSVAEVLACARKGAQPGLSEFHLVGGINPQIPFSYYIDILNALKNEFPAVQIQAFTAVEIAHLAGLCQCSIKETLMILRDAGLDSLPGGGAEIFSPRIRNKICSQKLSSDQWLDVMRQAHNLGISSNATMLYGHYETIEERVEHFIRLRALQDDTDGFLAFIPLAFHPHNTQMAELPRTSAIDDLKTIAAARLMLDNFPHIKAFWIMLGLPIAQLSLCFGADDIDGTVMEERITHAAGATTAQALTRNQLKNLIQEVGQIPVERDTLYNFVETYSLVAQASST
ncbi:MAG: aminofutalosine synthase MqnE [Candidatus Schekmanbacteria bacterium]|nr:aminofutalosine synthase MqnE [Candidatus Schekmanbacteria bacterium]